MITTNYPNRDALYVSYTIYRDAMRRFIIRCLEKNCDTRPEQLINKALNRSEDNNIEINNAAPIDIGDFPTIIVAYWKNTVSFYEEFDSDSQVRNNIETIKRGRKLWAHPRLGDTDPEETQKLLFLISKVLGEINEPDEKRQVDRLFNQLFPYNSKSNLEKVQGELATLKKHQEAIDDRLAVVEEHCTTITDTLNQLRTALEKPFESTEYFTNERNQPTEIEGPAYEESTTNHPSLESSPLQNSTEVSNTLQVGEHLTGKVKNIIPEGIFVTLDNGKGEGFIYPSDLTLKSSSINHPSDVISQDDEVEVIVIDLNEDDSKKSPSLWLKSKHDEWTHRVKKEYQMDLTVQGTITHIHDTLGALVELEEGISGLIHQSTIPPNTFESLREEQNVKVRISRIDFENEKIALHLNHTLGQDPIR